MVQPVPGESNAALAQPRGRPGLIDTGATHPHGIAHQLHGLLVPRERPDQAMVAGLL